MRPPFELYTDDVDVWHIHLPLPATHLLYLESILSADEMHRARRFRFLRDRERYVAARGLLRILLGRYLSLEPARLRFSYGPYGKPSLSVESCGDGLGFNLSHSGGLIAFALARGRRVGIDVERVRPIADGESLVERFFSESEKTSFRALPSERRRGAFFTCWTRKEAYVKARGEGLSFPLDAFDVPVSPEEPPRITSTRGDPVEANRWTMKTIRVGRGYAGTVAAEGHGWHLRVRTLEPYIIRCEEHAVTSPS